MKKTAREKERFRVEPHACDFKAGIDLDKLTQFSDELEVEELARKVTDTDLARFPGLRWFDPTA